ncbi:MAG: hypothetical protein IPN72_05550 [Saprospiraceae bacterium]|nr:hypothetical protein [Saprospiraceae bacterium]
MLLKLQNSSLENFAGAPTPPVFSASTFELLSSQSQWSFHIRLVYVSSKDKTHQTFCTKTSSTENEKFLIYSLFTVAIIVFGAIIFFKIKSEPKPTIVSENGDELARAMQTTLDVSAWDSLHFLHWSFRGDTEYTWDKVQNLVVVKWDGNQVNLTLDKVEGIAFTDGVQAGKWKTKWLVRKAWKKWCNDSYWMFAPFKVFDSGTRRTIAKRPDGTQGLWVEY